MGTHPKRLELSWHKPTKQWRKRFKGKEYYLGVGKGKGKRLAAAWDHDYLLKLLGLRMRLP